MPETWTCLTVASGTECTVTASSTVGLYNGANFQEWLFIAGIVIFFLSFITWARVFRPIKTLYEN